MVEGDAPVSPPKKREKLFVGSKARADVYEHTIAINRLMKRASCQANFVVKRLKFNGPADPMDIPEAPEEGGEPPAVDEERKAAEFKLYDDFGLEQKQQIEELAEKLCEFKFY